MDVLEFRAERSAIGAAPDVAAVVDVVLNVLSPKSNQYTRKKNDPSIISAREA